MAVFGYRLQCRLCRFPDTCRVGGSRPGRHPGTEPEPLRLDDPEEASAEFYGFYSVFSRFSSIWGPLTFGVVNTITGSSRTAVLSLVVLFVIGFVLLALVNVEKARASKERWAFVGETWRRPRPDTARRGASLQ